MASDVVAALPPYYSVTRLGSIHICIFKKASGVVGFHMVFHMALVVPLRIHPFPLLLHPLPY